MSAAAKTSDPKAPIKISELDEGDRKLSPSSLCHTFNPSALHTVTMIRREILQQGRSITSYTPSRSISQLPSFLRSTHPQPLSSIFAKPFPPRLGQRWQSTATETESKASSDSDASQIEATKTAQAEKDDLAKKELESKSREIIDLKVRPRGTAVLILSTTQTPPLLASSSSKVVTKRS